MHVGCSESSPIVTASEAGLMLLLHLAQIGILLVGVVFGVLDFNYLFTLVDSLCLFFWQKKIIRVRK